MSKVIVSLNKVSVSSETSDFYEAINSLKKVIDLPIIGSKGLTAAIKSALGNNSIAEKDLIAIDAAAKALRKIADEAKFSRKTNDSPLTEIDTILKVKHTEKENKSSSGRDGDSYFTYSWKIGSIRAAELLKKAGFKIDKEGIARRGKITLSLHSNEVTADEDSI